mmetsp:Transcript_52779/g.146534  ORF Transcript_52779/g.146534 Transcript_52779/m.146534 type:complete len:256 (+) Transcript_52779:3-770(+)
MVSNSTEAFGLIDGVLALPERFSMEYWLCGAWVAGFLFGIVSIAYNCWKRPSDELSVLRRTINTLARLMFWIVVLATPLAFNAFSLGHPLVRDATTFATKGLGVGSMSWNFGVGRPISVVVFGAALGATASVHPAMRWALVLLLVAQVCLDTLACGQFHLRLECIESGKCLYVPGYDKYGMFLLWARELAALVLDVWALLILGHIFVMHGCATNLYTPRQLSQAHDSLAALNYNFEKFGLLPTAELERRKMDRSI